MQIRFLETLVRIHQVQSFSKAAELQNMTLSALSMQMKTLENALDAGLFDRSFRPPKLTPLGRSVAVQAERVLHEHRTMARLCQQDGALSGLFRLGVVSSASIRLLPKFLERFSGRAPQATFELSIGLSEDLSEQVSLGLIDGAVVTRMTSPQTNLDFHILCSEEMAFAVPASYRGTPVRDLSRQLPFIHYRPTTGIGKLITETMQPFGAGQPKPIILDNMEAIVEFVKAGLGYTRLPLPDLLRCADTRLHIHAGHPDTILRELVLVSRQQIPESIWIPQIADGFRQVAEAAGRLALADNASSD